MNSLTFCFVASLALASGKPFFPVVYQYQNVVPQPYGAPILVHQPTSYAAASVPAFTSPLVRVVSPIHNRYHAQSEDGSYSFGYSGGPSSRAETRDRFGNVQGAFNYVDPRGQIQTQQYVADSNGFRVAATNLPIAPAPISAEGPKPVEETAEVKAARASFEEAFNKRTKREADPAFFTSTTYTDPANTAPIAPPVNAAPVVSAVPTTYAAGTTFTTGTQFPFTYFPNIYNSAPATVPFTYNTFAPHPIVYGAAAQPTFNFKPGQLTKIVHNPGFAVSYRVDA